MLWDGDHSLLGKTTWNYVCHRAQAMVALPDQVASARSPFELWEVCGKQCQSAFDDYWRCVSELTRPTAVPDMGARPAHAALAGENLHR